MSQQKLEPFPPISPQPTSGRQNGSARANGGPRPRRKSSSLGGEPRGDTGAAASATLSSSSTSSASISRTSSDRTKPHSKRRKARSASRRFTRSALRHTWSIPSSSIALILSLYALNPTESNPLHKCIFLSYPLPRASPDAPTLYGKGGADFAFVAFYTIVSSFTREFLMQRAIRPLALRLGIRNKGKQARFMEQFYTAIYFAIFGPYGLYVMKHSAIWYFNTTAMFEGFPHRSHVAIFKAYYSSQASYWAQQGLVSLSMLEKPRKDFKELCLHHVVTLASIWLSYRFHFTYMGSAVYITHDISDFFLATSKVLNYLNSPITAPYFALFIGVWTYSRHYINSSILYAVSTEFRTVGPYESNWETQQYKCWISQIITFASLFASQAVNIFWSVSISRIAYRFVVTNVAEDERSENEEEEDEIEAEEREMREKYEEKTPSSEQRKESNGNAKAPEVSLNGESVHHPEIHHPEVEAPVASGRETPRRSARSRKA